MVNEETLRQIFFTVPIFLFTTASRPALGLTQAPIQWVPGALSLGVKRSGREAHLTTHFHLVPRSKMRRAIHPFPKYAS